MVAICNSLIFSLYWSIDANSNFVKYRKEKIKENQRTKGSWQRKKIHVMLGKKDYKKEVH